MAKRLFKTKFEALIACRNHWQFMEITGSRNNHAYAPAENWYLFSAACEWDRYFRSDCENCILRGYAWEDFCDNPCSLWSKWAEPTGTKHTKFYANRMVYACNQAIEGYLLNEKED